MTEDGKTGTLGRNARNPGRLSARKVAEDRCPRISMAASAGRWRIVVSFGVTTSGTASPGHPCASAVLSQSPNQRPILS